MNEKIQMLQHMTSRTGRKINSHSWLIVFVVVGLAGSACNRVGSSTSNANHDDLDIESDAAGGIIEGGSPLSASDIAKVRLGMSYEETLKITGLPIPQESLIVRFPAKGGGDYFISFVPIDGNLTQVPAVYAVLFSRDSVDFHKAEFVLPKELAGQTLESYWKTSTELRTVSTVNDEETETVVGPSERPDSQSNRQ